jgi:hypothetical protein
MRDYSFRISFHFDTANLSHFDISVLIDRVMASVGFILKGDTGGSASDPAEESFMGAEYGPSEIPTASYGWPIRSTHWWPQRKLIDPSRDVLWDSASFFCGGDYWCDIKDIRLFDDLVQRNSKFYRPSDPSDPESRPIEDETRSAQLWPLHCFGFAKGSARLQEASAKPGWLYLDTNVFINYARRSALDRYWVLVLTDTVLQILSALKCEEAEFYTDTDCPPQFSLGKTVAPYFWPAGFFEFKPSGDAKVDAVLDAYEQELRDDPLRKKVLSQEIPLPKSL